MKLALTALLTLSCGGLAWAQTQPQLDTPSTQSQGSTTQMPTSPAGGQPAGVTSPSTTPREVTVDLKTEAPPPQDPRAAREEAEAALRYARTEGCRDAGSREAQRECLRQAQSDYREALGQSTPLQRSRH